METVLTIAGSDSGGGAGIQADLKTFQELGVFGTSAITALTAQNTRGVHGVLPAAPEFVTQQIDCVMADFPVKAVKTGMLFSAEIIQAVADSLKKHASFLVVDPVMIAKDRTSLLQQSAVSALITELLPLATLVTPNIPEAETLSGLVIETQDDISAAAKRILAAGAEAVVIKGGHLSDKQATDYIFTADTVFTVSTPRIETRHTHGTGCTFSAACTAFLAQGYHLRDAIIEAKKFIHLAISQPINLGSGHGPTNHFAYHINKGNCEVAINDIR
ncbi:bifunctional hydroxymethylpyrimidine kinase/phosphomethylpyrimidine kinase [Vagococcus acidifermentans]|uniref:Hydroxymethylpyrimidine/phosphomethylpyrimidine kinase n=1 Tax=Vagococcus acidifermentans TaxID=564710 RepID=A0A430AQQ6_9ENTE|nr:bifunctional hydroxymethylpyrimidine kinase/phosphomethylpyrimidine kinase [Vagococcus acidifermentans]RSU10470.1 bifunctional hydroxymethylpyrimidine kinase/phosphomethylpyrimidine kinase [Vagococcus acidifermentans]